LEHETSGEETKSCRTDRRTLEVASMRKALLHV
jgi:hypothetical protein